MPRRADRPVDQCESTVVCWVTGAADRRVDQLQCEQLPHLGERHTARAVVEGREVTIAWDPDSENAHLLARRSSGPRIDHVTLGEPRPGQRGERVAWMDGVTLRRG